MARVSKQNRGNTSKVTDNGKQRDRNNLLCHQRKKPGHFISKYPEWNTSSSSSSKYAFNTVFLSGNYNKQDFYLDSGASKHMTPNIHWIKNRTKASVEDFVVTNKEKLSVKCCGDIEITTCGNGRSYNVTVKDVLYVLGLTTNLLSLSQFISTGNRVPFTRKGCFIYSSNNELLATANLVDGLYKLNLKEESSMLTVARNDSEIWQFN